MDDYEYSCPGCGTDDISFLKIENVGEKGKEKGLFYCNICQKDFTKNKIKPGYLPNVVVLLKARYPIK